MGELISAAYRALNADLHAVRADYGNRGHRHANWIDLLAEEYKCRSILDYGCGKGDLARRVKCWDVRAYDPAIPEYAEAPRPADLVACMDVLEHVEPDKIHAVLDHLRSLTWKICAFSICTEPSGHFLADGRNAHILLRSSAWWTAQLEGFFEIVRLRINNSHVKGAGIPKVS